MRFVLISIGICLVWGCNRGKYKFDEGEVYGTYFHVTYDSKQNYAAEIRAEMERVNRSLSMFNKNSVISKLNRNECDSVDVLFERMFAKAKEVYQNTDGAFDITVAPLVNAWGFGFKHEQLPDSTRVDSLLQFVGMYKLRVENGKLFKSFENVQMDASAIAKGLGTDLVADFFESKGIANYMVEIGGEVRSKGINPRNQVWRIGIDKPVDDVTAMDRKIELVVNLREGALATSGNYRNFYLVDGKKYSHTINPKTGFPVQRNILSASVHAPTCMEADAYATSFMVLGTEMGKTVVEQHPELEACFIYENEKGEQEIWMSDGFKTLISTE